MIFIIYIFICFIEKLVTTFYLTRLKFKLIFCGFISQNINNYNDS